MYLADVAPLFWIGASLYAIGNGGFGPIPSVYAIDVLPPGANASGNNASAGGAAK